MQEAAGASDEFGANLTPIKSRRDFEQLIKGEGPTAVYSSCVHAVSALAALCCAFQAAVLQPMALTPTLVWLLDLSRQLRSLFYMLLLSLSTPAGDKPVVVDFMAGWCGKCRMIAPFVDELAEKHPGLVRT